MKHIVIGTAGHIDHGKSALVRALTGTDPDRLREEKERGITIDLGFAPLDLGDGVHASFVDVPGHERFVKNMLAGATGMDAVLLVVAADESIKPQTREHFDICRLLGLRCGLVAITKSDLADADMVELVRLEIQEFTAGSFLDGAPVISVSSRTGAGLESLKAELRRLALQLAVKPADRPFRLPIDRAFVMKGFGSVITGTLIAGKIEKEAEVEIFPLGRRVRVRGVEVHNQPAEAACAGQRTALNLAGIDTKDLQRGMMLARPHCFTATGQLDCLLNLLPSARPLKNRARVHFHCWTAETVAEAVIIDGKEIRPGGDAFVQLRLAKPGLFLPGDPFIIRQFSPLVTMGGGQVLDPHPAKYRPADAARRPFLETLAKANPPGRLELLLRAKGEASLTALIARTGLEAPEILKLAADVDVAGRVRVLGDPPGQLIHTTAFEELAENMLQALARFHKANPLVAGMSKEGLRGQASLRAHGSFVNPSPAAFQSALESLTIGRRIETRGETVSLAGRGVQLDSQEAAAKQEISRAFEQAGLRVPATAEVLASLSVDRTRAEKILQMLLKEKALHKIAEGLIFHRSALEGLRKLLEERKARDNRLSISTFKELTGVSRKYAIPLLEYLDRERVTRRSGEERVII
ncbi:MAG: selenocysteine-specific translation elongation factor [Terriglobia bacterium]